MSRKITIPAVENYESISSCEVLFHSFKIRVGISKVEDKTVFDTDNNESIISVVDGTKSIEYIVIEDDLYRALMSGHPTWSPQKPEGMFGRDEIWDCIDAARDGATLNIGVETKVSKDKL